MIVNNHGPLTLDQMLELLKPGALNPQQISGNRIRWAYITTRANEQETKRVSDQLKERHLQLGAREVLVHHAPWSKDEDEQT
jgi:hypothetical protein